MKTISAKIIADSMNISGQRITTFVLTFPRSILAELNTHRVFSRNSASSRAIPYEVMRREAIENAFIPYAWQKAHKGMQGKQYIEDPQTITHLRYQWLKARDAAIVQADRLNELGVTKQICNRLLEPFLYHTAIVTTTELSNFFQQRLPKYKVEDNLILSSKKQIERYLVGSGFIDPNFISFLEALKINEGMGEIHIMELAEKMLDELEVSKPNQLKEGDWHIPFGEDINLTRLFNEEIKGLKNLTSYILDDFPAKIKIATARCARISYLNFLGKDDYVSDIKLHDALYADKHASPFEHCAQCMSEEDQLAQKSSGNFVGFHQYRQLIKKQFDVK
ncbi:putative thymidylate synthase complementing protein [Cellulophaga phage phi13:1]|uniref:Putative thymidylate synthase complementing protein n=1 Tax=Cellulophaga phage phi13:1 TaxID=1327992 RepID=S0A4E0_9CAUD|nr:putative thymidylate synthase complementing protein [Cellulophaga phage phi13:1]